jgi:hypothetical protein
MARSFVVGLKEERKAVALKSKEEKEKGSIDNCR